MSGAVALHGGGEFEAGDDTCVSAVLGLAAVRVARDAGLIRVVIVPTATARWSPDRSAAHAVAGFERVATRDGLTVETRTAMVIDAESAADPAIAALLDSADLIAFPGGDPDVIAAVMPGSLAWAAIVRAHGSGALLHGASAGAMALAPWTWTPVGGVAGLDVVPGIVVVPHADAASWDATIERFGASAPAGLGFLGLAERTAAVTSDPMADPVTWQVVGEGEVRWLAARGGALEVVRAGDRFETPGRTA